MSGLTTHVLDTALGKPARGLVLRLSILEDGAFEPVSERTTDDDGRASDLLAGRPLEARTYRLTFDTGPYLSHHHGHAFYPHVDVVFTIARSDEHYHVPLLLSPFGYSTYRGS